MSVTTAPLVVIATVSADATLAQGRITPVDASGAVRTMTLPTGAAQGVTVVAAKIDASANAVNVTGNIRGVPAQTIALSSQYEVRMFVADSSGSWWPINDHRTTSSLNALIAAALPSTATGKAILAAADKPAARAAAGLVTGTPGAGEVQLVDPSAIQVSQWMPDDMGWKAWTGDPLGISTASNWTSGTLQCWGMIARQAMSLNTVVLSIGAAIAGATAGQSLVGIYQGGSRLAQSADQSASGFASTGRKDIALTSAASVAAGLFYVVVLSVATTTPQVHTGGSAGAMNSATVVRWGTANTGQTSLPSTLGAISGATPNQRAFWAAVA